MQFRPLVMFLKHLLYKSIFFGILIMMIIVVISILKSLIHSLTCGFAQEEAIEETETTTEVYYDLSSYEVKIYSGSVTMEEVNEKLFKTLGFEIMYPTLPVPTLRRMKFKEPTCSTVFSEYLGTENKLPNGEATDGVNFQNNDFLMNGFSAFNKTKSWSKDAKRGNVPKNWDKISEMMELTTEQIVKLSYNEQTGSMFSALRMSSIDGMSGLVVGSVTPWLEVMALQNGAAQILTIEKNELQIEDEYRDRLLPMHPMEFANKWGMYADSFDFVATFGFVERSGLGLESPMDPIGDIREIMKIKCVLKEGGILYLGLPYGTDALQLESHRIYGPIRLAILFSGFEWIATFTGKSQKHVRLNSQRRHARNLFKPIYYTFVLKKL